MQPLFLVFGIQLAGLLEHPAFFVGVIGWLIGGAVNFTRAIEYAVQTGRARIVLVKWLFPLAGLGAAESGVNCSVIGIIAIASAFVCVTSELAVAVFDLGGACLGGMCFCYEPTNYPHPRKSGS